MKLTNVLGSVNNNPDCLEPIIIDNSYIEVEKLIHSQHFITYGNNNYTNSKKRILKEAELLNVFKSMYAYGPEDLDNEFIEKFKSTLEFKIGGGYWVWKFYIIKKKLLEIEDGDFLVYCDAGCTINIQGKDTYNEYLQMLDNCKYGIISIPLRKNINDNGLVEKNWTTKNLFEYFNIELDSEIANSAQFVGGILVMQKKPHLINIIDEALKLIEYDQRLITDYFNNIDQELSFVDNRHDQSILSLLRKKYGSIILESDQTFKFHNIQEKFKYPFWATRIKE
jgi:hypothetical protein